MDTTALPKRWWLPPLLWSLAFLAGTLIVLASSATAREVVGIAVKNLVGLLATPFILEATTAIIGLTIVVLWNQWRIQKEGDGWVYLARTEPDAASVEAGADKAERRLAAVVLPEPPDAELGFEARLAIAEGYLELGLQKEALEHLAMLSSDEQSHEKATALRRKAEAQGE